MRIIVSAFVAVSLLAGLPTITAAPAAAGEKAYASKKKKHHRYRAHRYYGAYYGSPLYYERLANRLPLGSNVWWDQMDREQRGGRR